MLSSELTRSALESAPDAMIIADEQGRILFANRQLTTLFGYEPAETPALTVELLMPERLRPQHIDHRRAFVAEQRMRLMGVGLELLARRKDGSEFPVEISLSPIRDGERVLVAAAIRDITERRRIQNELLAAQQSAERANHAKSRFLATASHDLRQPLQSLALLNGTLRRMVRDPDAREALAHQDQAIGAMAHLLNALLDMSKLESGAIRPEPADVEVAALFEELGAEFAGVAADKGLVLEVTHARQCVHSDPALLGQILRNLLSNAIKYTRAGRVRLVALSGPGTVRLEVIDTGIGIAPDQLAHIYDEFYQVERDYSGQRGYGLGLSIVRRLVDLLGIRLDVRSELKQGSVFALDLPTGRPRTIPAPQPAAEDTLPLTTDPSRVLLVEDDPAVRDATRMLLKVEGYRVSAAGTVAEALAHVAEHDAFDLVITDYHLGGGETGSDVITRLRERLGQDLPAVLITGDTSAAIRQLEDSRLRLANKPIQADQLLGLLRSLLANGRGSVAPPAPRRWR